jgi:hypothetical protein
MRKMVLTMAVAALAALGATTASASAAPTTTCENSGTVKLSPGLSTSPTTQNITVKGTLSNCAGEESTVTSGNYVAHLKTTEPVTCGSLASAGAPTEGTVVVKWGKGVGNSHGSFSEPLTELPTTISGLIASGPFEGETISGSVTQSFEGGATCGVPTEVEGKKPKKAKKVKKGTVAGSLTIS